MTLRMRPTVAGLLVVVALGASGALFVASTSGGGKTKDLTRDVTSRSQSSSAFCAGDDNGFAIGAEVARRQIELWTTGSTTVTTAAPCVPGTANGSR